MTTGNSAVSVFWTGPATLGEGPLWDPRTDTLYWVDIVAGAVFAQDAGAESPRRLELGVQVGCLGLTDDSGVLVAGLRSGWHLLDLGSGDLEFLADPEADRPSCRFNDGSVDAAGRFWTGSLEDGETRPVGRLYRLDSAAAPSADAASDAAADHAAAVTVAVADEGFYCSNGIDWSPDARWMYFVDSRADVIYRYPFDVATGELGERQVFADTSGLDGIPDGLRVDAAGDVWCAMWDGAQIVRFSPEGSVAGRLPVPVLRPTSVAFGGPDLRTMYITSASIDLTEDQLAAWPLSGAVLRYDAEVPGPPPNRFRSRREVQP